MIHRLRISFPLIFFAFLILATIWLDQLTRPSEKTKGDDTYRYPDYIVEDLSGTRMDHERTIQRKFSAKKLFHYLDEETTQMEQISFINTELENPPIRLHADYAEVKGKGKNIYLVGNVTALRETDDEKNKMTLSTNFLHLIPEENLAKTDQSVTISKLHTTINAVGLELNNQTGVIRLLTRVKAVNNK
jgi:lipopolysaccharide export system protein LptC